MNLLALQYIDINRSIALVSNEAEIVQARPVFPNSLLSTEVQVTLPTPNASDFSHYAGTSAENGHRVLDYPVDNSLYYRLQDPLPDYLGKQLYRAGAHITGIFENESSLAKVDTPMVHELHSLINKERTTPDNLKHLRTQFFIENKNLQPDKKKNQALDASAINIRKLSHVSHRLTVIGKASLVLCDSPGIAVDAIRALVPAALLGEIPPEFEKLQKSLIYFLQHKNCQQLLAEQQHAVDTIVQPQCQLTFVMSKLSTLHDFLADQSASDNQYVAKKNRHESATNVQSQDDLILSSQQLLFDNPRTAVRLKSGLESGRRKLQKFKESPVRFIEDSQSRLLKTLTSGKTLQ